MHVALKCLFCQSPIEAPEDSEFSSGDFIKCHACGEENDFDSVIEVAKEEGISEVTVEVQNQLAKTLKRLFKK